MIGLMPMTMLMTSMSLSHGPQALHFHLEEHTVVSTETAGLNSVSEFSVAATSMAVTVPHTVWPEMTVEAITLVEQMERGCVGVAGVSLQENAQLVRN